MNKGRILVLGGARSGKSRMAEEIAEASGLARFYLATAEGQDEEMRQRIAEHRTRRGADWQTLETPLDLEAALADTARPDRAVLVDCLTLWLSNILLAKADASERIAALVSTLKTLPGLVIVVSNEVGMGLVPDNALGRSFRDAQGRLNQSAAKVCETVIFVSAGLPLALKGDLPSWVT
jgi:adenosylcobinamide kinase/adenosylcobinamide-phosphate guanylyltransferase